MNYKTLHVSIIAFTVSSIAFTVSSFAIGMEIKRPSLMTASKLGDVRLYHQNNHFIVERNGKKNKVKSYNISPILRNASPEFLSKFLIADGYLKLNDLRNENGSIDYKLDAQS